MEEAFTTISTSTDKYTSTHVPDSGQNEVTQITQKSRSGDLGICQLSKLWHWQWLLLILLLLLALFATPNQLSFVQFHIFSFQLQIYKMVQPQCQSITMSSLLRNASEDWTRAKMFINNFWYIYFIYILAVNWKIIDLNKHIRNYVSKHYISHS